MASIMDEDLSKDTPSEHNDVSSDEDDSQSGTELMVTTRTRRATAGNRYSALVALEEPEEDAEDEVAMLFAEGEGEDDDFNSDEGDEDADMSSSDDDDQGPNVATNDLEGEQEIEKQAKAERAKKRKADLALTTVSGLRKKPRIDPTALRRAPAPKPSKRKERVSWLPESDIAPGRISLRKQTILHRAETHAKLKVNEEQRLKSKAKREKREREKEATAPKEMTQADRLAEAERIERRNAKSLNRWEAMEKKRAEEQAAKLAALKERKLEGAVITWYSSRAKYLGIKEVKTIDIEVPTEPKKRGRKPKALLEQLAAARLANEQRAILAPKHESTPGTNQLLPLDLSSASTSLDISPESTAPSAPTGSEAGTTLLAVHAAPSPAKTEMKSGSQRDSEASFLTGIHEYASMPSDTKSTDPAATVKDEKTNNPETLPEEPTLSTAPQDVRSTTEQTNAQAPPREGTPSSTNSPQETPEVHTEVTPATGTENTETALPATTSIQGSTKPDDIVMPDIDIGVTQTTEVVSPHADKAVQPESLTEQKSPVTTTTTVVEGTQSRATLVDADNGQNVALTPPTEPPIEVISTRNLVILDRFDGLPDQARQSFGMFFNHRKTAKPVKHSQELCPVTGLPARYRDPDTGIAYANAAAYKKLQELKRHHFTWCSMLGCYVGRSDIVARGVPEGFLGL